MLYPTINELTKGEYNRYELALATAKCARLVTNEYVRQREKAESSMTGNKDTDRPLVSMIDAQYRDEKAVKVAVGHLSSGDYAIVRLTPEELAEEAKAREASALEETTYSEIPDMLPDEGEDGEKTEETAEEPVEETSAEGEAPEAADEPAEKTEGTSEEETV